MKTDEIKQSLQHIPLFEGCNATTLAAIAGIATERDYEKGAVLYEAGDVADNVYVLVDGIVTFIHKSGLAFLNVQKVMGRSIVFGWAAVVSDTPKRVGSAQCLEDSKIVAIDGRKLLDILDSDPKSGLLVMKRMCALIANTFLDKPERGI